MHKQANQNEEGRARRRCIGEHVKAELTVEVRANA